MATLALTVAGAAVGSALLPAGLTVLGATISGAVIGSQVGALAGTYIDQSLFGTSGQARAVSGPRLSDLKITSSTEGTPVPRLFGRTRLGGQVIWATELEEVASSSSAGGGSKGGASTASASGSVTEYRYFANFAVAICEGVITGLGRVWADGQELDLSLYDWRLYKGTETQEPDGLIIAHEGADAAPAYRGTAYIVLERMPLAAFGNRLPQLSFEVFRSVDPFESQIRGVVMIPGSGEFVYAPEPVERRTGSASAQSENTHTLKGGTDWEVAVDQLDETLPNARSTSLVVSWFGSDLRAGECQIRPAVDSHEKETSPIAWSVAGVVRETAAVVSSADQQAAYGGTPSDQTVLAAIQDLKARGHKVLLTPFILMDIPAANTLEDPYSGNIGQPAHPWRGRITCDPAPGQPGSVDKTPAAAAQIANFVGTAQLSDFSLSGESVVYSGPSEWSLRRMVLHYAMLAVAAGGVDAIVIGTELRGLTQVRSGADSYPFVSALEALATDVKSIVGPGTKVTYAADWSEYFGHQPADGSGDVYFHLDPLWASPSIDAIAIDCYWPLSDWRDGDGHQDRVGGARSPYDLDYLKSNVIGGEGFDWYYASPGDRDEQVRTPITDGAGKPWVFRYKDAKGWWSNQHFNRPGGIEATTPTPWVPFSKPIWLTEIGCPAVDKGANQPNVFVDPKSTESFLPYYSRGVRDDLMQRRYLQALLEAFDPDHIGYLADANPISPVYGDRMIDLEHVHVYAWDARPFPAFPNNRLVWSDGGNWQLGHWLNGRIAGQSLASVVAALLDGFDFADYEVGELEGIVMGLVLDRPMSAREALQPLELAYFVDVVESGGNIRFRHRGGEASRAAFTLDDLVEAKPGSDLVRLTRGQETELPASARLSYASLESDYRQGVAQSRRLVGASGRMAEAQLALVMSAAQATRTADAWLFEAWTARERARFIVPPSLLALEPGDVVTLQHAGAARLFRVVEVGDHGAREIEALAIDPDIYVGGTDVNRPDEPVDGPETGAVLGLFLDLPLLTGNEPEQAGYVAAARTPWPGAAAFYRSPDTSGYQLAAMATRNATTGVTLDDLVAGPEWRLDHGARVRVQLDTGSLTSTTRLNLLAGSNVAAIQGGGGDWEVIQFETATLVGPLTYELTTLLRGQAGTEGAMGAVIAAGARFVLLDAALTIVALSEAEVGLPLNWRYGPANLDLGTPPYRGVTHSFVGLGRRPLSPVHIRGVRSAGDLSLSWSRRTRIGGDGWIADDVPLAEDVERYEIDIVAGGDVVRTLVASSPAATYTAAEQTEDFGGPQSAVTVRLCQVSSVFGRGAQREAIV